MLDALEGEGLLSESRYAEAYVSQRSARGFGPLRIQEELKSRGLTQAAADWVDVNGPEWEARARAAREKRFGAAGPTDLRERARQMRFLQYRGFTAAQIRSALGGTDD